MITEQQRLIYQNSDLRSQIVDLNKTIQVQEMALTNYERRIARQESRLKSLLWTLLALTVALILAVVWGAK